MASGQLMGEQANCPAIIIPQASSHALISFPTWLTYPTTQPGYLQVGSSILARLLLVCATPILYGSSLLVLMYSVARLLRCCTTTCPCRPPVPRPPVAPHAPPQCRA
eukprot:2042895-Rhodomonas_salina.2